MDGPARSAEREEIGRYTVFAEIASGATGAVHFAQLRGEGGFARTVVIKRMLRSKLGDADLVAMFVDEARTAVRVRHPNVVATLDVALSDGEVLVVMEYVDGESIEGLLRSATRPSVPPRIAASIVSGFLHGLHAAHEATGERGESLELVHRDVSPSNVIVGVDGTARILDFGIAKATGRLHVTREGRVKGKLAYMPPEQLYGEALDRRTDVYAAGVVLWEMLTGRRLFSEPTEAATVDRILHARVVPPGEIDASLSAFDAIVLRATSRSPDDRFETAQEMAVSIERSFSCAPPSEVGAWVESVAGAVLAERARTLSAIEASSGPSRSRIERRRRPFKPLIAAALCTAGVLVVIAANVRRGEGEGAPAAAPAALAPEAASAPTVAPLPLPAARASAQAPSPSRARAVTVSSVDGGPRARRISSPPGTDECTMPYVMDSEGRRHYKPKCLR